MLFFPAGIDCENRLWRGEKEVVFSDESEWLSSAPISEINAWKRGAEGDGRGEMRHHEILKMKPSSLLS